MNDFTKEELEELNQILHRNAWQAIDARRLNLLHKKLQSMIENYCEHEFREYPLGVTAIPFCNKCKKAVL